MKDNKRLVKLRKKKEKTGRISLFLDTYINGTRKYEYLRMYLIGDKKTDNETLKVAQSICDMRNEQAKEEANTKYDDDIRRMTIHRFIDLHCNVKYQKMKLWIPESDKISQINKDYERLFIDKILNSDHLSEVTKKNYISIFRVIKNKATDFDAIKTYKSPSVKLKVTQHERQYLSIEELKTLAELPLTTRIERETRDAFCFSALTGLRVSDLRSLTWENVHETDGYHRIVFKQTKTRSREYLDISENAFKFLGDRTEGKIWKHAKLSNKTLIVITGKAGIKKHITFHCARHTFAIMMLSLGVDIYTLSKLLGHSDIAITQVYARILDKGKRSAVDLIPQI